MTSLSLVIPFFNEKESLPELIGQLYAAMNDPELHNLFDAPFSFEIILVDDGSTDGSTDLAHTLCASNSELRLISFQRNFGKTAALTAGFLAAEGKAVCTLDADLQDDPASIRPLAAKLFEGYDLVSGWKKKRMDPPGKTIPSKFFNAVTRIFTGIPIHDFNCGIKMYRREVIKRIELHGDMHRYIPVIAGWNGFRITELPVNHRPRRYGSTKFGTARFLAGLFDFLAVLFITRYFRRPMHFFGMAGLISFLSGFSISLYVTLEKVLNLKPVSNRPILFLGILLIILGAQLFSTGLLGEMLSTSAQGGNRYTVKETNNLSEKQEATIRRQ
ncbi:MAG: glycosyltransferase family 2 protein [Chlorobium sp.]|uniref:glycosyltransferase family 2 protein n=1 Tax=Chlorobium sp. TaxID=1095 RepID=UPI0025C0422D|nr:glycosyltransferase family 2 protein [Chlorobium sp.]MCF8216266.1 glycosyltransferase family 2 protein [Chlorobium sp.]MCF8271168.1 glycosyltransferase family 2 protein [Chlorobium sp.]MCF8287568.1 glycosyltransferase family 2 protein [Chlorobium sp.]MCF8291081.1 glycosyltransferase family 2 protein [Chlorobium sp.]MCF8385202.1 glycosyltransferase family 2 protein [Chlorobium sp.]